MGKFLSTLVIYYVFSNFWLRKLSISKTFYNESDIILWNALSLDEKDLSPHNLACSSAYFLVKAEFSHIHEAPNPTVTEDEQIIVCHWQRDLLVLSHVYWDGQGGMLAGNYILRVCVSSVQEMSSVLAQPKSELALFFPIGITTNPNMVSYVMLSFLGKGWLFSMPTNGAEADWGYEKHSLDCWLPKCQVAPKIPKGSGSGWMQALHWP